ncbi:MAG TPA: hypothetical protein VE175_01000 [Woeseiaceae bacterium]|jgi:hypothetical protein|nr:hypothetical protein [Woeseiaceae bacterium]
MFQLQSPIPGPAIRRQMIEALAYPCMLVLSNMDVDECPQHGYFNPAHPACRVCEQGDECQWLNANSEITVLADRPMEQLYDSLAFGIEYIDVQCSRAGHNVRRCACESCGWVREARRLTRRYRNT